MQESSQERIVVPGGRPDARPLRLPEDSVRPVRPSMGNGAWGASSGARSGQGDPLSSGNGSERRSLHERALPSHVLGKVHHPCGFGDKGRVFERDLHESDAIAEFLRRGDDAARGALGRRRIAAAVGLILASISTCFYRFQRRRMANGMRH